MTANNQKQQPEGSNMNKPNEQGFTLLETSIDLVVMMIVTLATASLFVYAVNYNSGTGDRSAALAIAQQRLERLRRTPYSDTVMNTATATESVTIAGRNYTVVTTICSTSDCGGSSTLKIITIAVSPVSNNSWANAPATITSQRAAPTTGPYEGV